jgi:hypothetical protein
MSQYERLGQNVYDSVTHYSNPDFYDSQGLGCNADFVDENSELNMGYRPYSFQNSYSAPYDLEELNGFVPYSSSDIASQCYTSARVEAKQLQPEDECSYFSIQTYGRYGNSVDRTVTDNPDETPEFGCPKRDECKSSGSFLRPRDLKRHFEAMHRPTTRKYPCLIKGCARADNKSFSRKDHRDDHILKVHKTSREELKRLIRHDKTVC